MTVTMSEDSYTLSKAEFLCNFNLSFFFHRVQVDIFFKDIFDAITINKLKLNLKRRHARKHTHTHKQNLLYDVHWGGLGQSWPDG